LILSLTDLLLYPGFWPENRFGFSKTNSFVDIVIEKKFLRPVFVEISVHPQIVRKLLRQ
jgi:hypothetical protein